MTRTSLALVVAIALGLSACAPPGGVARLEEASTTGLVQVTGYGDDYDHLNMWKYVPAGMPPKSRRASATTSSPLTSPLTVSTMRAGVYAVR